MSGGSPCSRHNTTTAGCHDCRRTNRAYDRRRRTAIRNGTWLYPVPVEQIRAHITQLRTQGMTVAAISRAANVSIRTLADIIHIRRRTRQVHGATAAAVLAVTAPTRPPLDAGFVDPAGTMRRIQALVAIGYPLSEQARRLGKQTQQVWEWAYGKQASVHETTAHAVAALFEELSATPGKSVRARNDANRRGWMPPLAWEDDEIDNPDGQPAIDAPEHADDPDPEIARRALQGQLAWGDIAKVDRPEVLRRIGETRIANSTAAALLRMNPTSLTTARRKYLNQEEAA